MSWERDKDRIIAGESGGDFNALYGHRKGYGNPTDMTFGEVFYDLAAPDGVYAQDVKNELGYTATPVGGFQIVGATGRDFMERYNIDPNMKFTPENQEMLAKLIYEEQGPGAYEALKKGGDMTARNHINNFDSMLEFNPEPMPQRYAMARTLGNVGDVLSSMGTGRGMSQMLHGDLVYKQAEKRHGRNQTAQYLSKVGRHDLASAVATGEMSGAAAMQLIYQQAGGAQNETFGTTPRVITGPDGKERTVLIGSNGTIKELDGNLSSGVERQILDDGTVVLRDKRTGQVVSVDETGADVQKQGDLDAQWAGSLDIYDKAAPIVKELYNHPGIEAAVGPIVGQYDMNTARGATALGEQGVAFRNLHNQLTGQAFLAAFESLKGAGPITDLEGKKATDALLALDLALSPAEYKKALNRFLGQLDNMVKKVEAARSGEQRTYNPIELDAGGPATFDPAGVTVD